MCFICLYTSLYLHLEEFYCLYSQKWNCWVIKLVYSFLPLLPQWLPNVYTSVMFSSEISPCQSDLLVFCKSSGYNMVSHRVFNYFLWLNNFSMFIISVFLSAVNYVDSFKVYAFRIILKNPCCHILQMLYFFFLNFKLDFFLSLQGFSPSIDFLGFRFFDYSS